MCPSMPIGKRSSNTSKPLALREYPGPRTEKGSASPMEDGACASSMEAIPVAVMSSVLMMSGSET